MEALPPLTPNRGSDRVTGVSCPDCPGVLGVTVRDRHLRFRCRVGHVYSLIDLVTAKEGRLEQRLWSCITALTELAALIRELADNGLLPVNAQSPYDERVARALRHAEAIRSVIEENAPIEIFWEPDRTET